MSESESERGRVRVRERELVFESECLVSEVLVC